jgi:hypothetical protein
MISILPPLCPPPTSTKSLAPCQLVMMYLFVLCVYTEECDCPRTYAVGVLRSGRVHFALASRVSLTRPPPPYPCAASAGRPCFAVNLFLLRWRICGAPGNKKRKMKERKKIQRPPKPFSFISFDQGTDIPLKISACK